MLIYMVALFCVCAITLTSVDSKKLYVSIYKFQWGVKIEDKIRMGLKIPVNLLTNFQRYKQFFWLLT